MDSVFYERFSALCKEFGESPNAVARIIGASSGSVTAWKRGADPRNATLAKIADHFGVTTDYLLGKEHKIALPDSSERDILDEVDVAFYGDFKELNEDEKETVRDMVRLMRQRKEKRSQ